MGIISFSSSGSFQKTESFLKKMSNRQIFASLNKYGQKGVDALEAATPVRTGLAAGSWSYKAEVTSRGASIAWYNSDTENGFPVAIMLQYGYATGTGGYVRGRDYINPAIQPIFDQIADDVWKEVTSA